MRDEGDEGVFEFVVLDELYSLQSILVEARSDEFPRGVKKERRGTDRQARSKSAGVIILQHGDHGQDTFNRDRSEHSSAVLRHENDDDKLSAAEFGVRYALGDLEAVRRVDLVSLDAVCVCRAVEPRFPERGIEHNDCVAISRPAAHAERAGGVSFVRISGELYLVGTKRRFPRHVDSYGIQRNVRSFVLVRKAPKIALFQQCSGISARSDEIRVHRRQARIATRRVVISDAVHGQALHACGICFRKHEPVLLQLRIQQSTQDFLLTHVMNYMTHTEFFQNICGVKMTLAYIKGTFITLETVRTLCGRPGQDFEKLHEKSGVCERGDC